MLSLKKCFYLRTHLFFPFPVFNLGRKSDDLFSGSQNSVFAGKIQVSGQDRILGFYGVLCYLYDDLITLFEFSLMSVSKQGYFVVGEAVIAGTPIGEIHKSGI